MTWLNLFVRILHQLLSYDLLLPLFQVDSEARVESLQYGLDQTEQVLQTFRVVAKLDNVGVANLRQPNPVVQHVVKKGAKRGDNLGQPQKWIHFLIFDQIANSWNLVQPEPQSEDLTAIGDVAFQFFGPIDGELFLLLDKLAIDGAVLHACHIKVGRILNRLGELVPSFAGGQQLPQRVSILVPRLNDIHGV